MGTLTILQSRFQKAENDLRERVTRAMEQNIQPLAIAVPVAALCSPTTNGFRVTVSSKWLPGQSFEAILSESSLQNLDHEWQEFCDRMVQTFIKGPLIFI